MADDSRVYSTPRPAPTPRGTPRRAHVTHSLANLTFPELQARKETLIVQILNDSLTTESMRQQALKEYAEGCQSSSLRVLALQQQVSQLREALSIASTRAANTQRASRQVLRDIEEIESRSEQYQKTIRSGEEQLEAVAGTRATFKAPESVSPPPPTEGDEAAALRTQVQAIETEVVDLRQKHDANIKTIRQLDEDIAAAKKRSSGATAVCKELQELHEKADAARSNVTVQQALHARDSHKELEKKAEERSKLLQEAHLEKKSMVAHLMDGARTRTSNLNKLRRGVSQQPAFVAAVAENFSVRETLLSALLSVDEEREAQQDYLDVLARRVSELSDCIHEETFRSDVSSTVQTQLICSALSA